MSDLLESATRVAISLDEHAKLVGIWVNKMSPTARIDLTSDNAVFFDFGYRYTDPTLPPGADVIAGRIGISTHAQYCEGPSPCFRIDRDGSTRLDHENARPRPKCSLARAWQSALASGMPSNAIATANYGFWEGPPQLWSFRVKDHDELARDIDGATCEVATRADVFRAMAKHAKGEPDDGGTSAARSGATTRTVSSASSQHTGLEACCLNAPVAKRQMCKGIADVVEAGRISSDRAMLALRAQGVPCPNATTGAPSAMHSSW